jgi:S1-C subfamily serine protease
MQLADSDLVRVGDFVTARGNSFGLGETVTLGIVNTLGQSRLNFKNLENFI